MAIRAISILIIKDIEAGRFINMRFYSCLGFKPNALFCHHIKLLNDSNIYFRFSKSIVS